MDTTPSPIQKAQEDVEALGIMTASFYDAMFRHGMPESNAVYFTSRWFDRMLDLMYPFPLPRPPLMPPPSKGE